MAREEKKSKNANEELTVDDLAQVATVSGWGKITVSRDSAQSLRVIARNCVFRASMKDPKERQIPCFFLRGIISGFTEVVHGSNQMEEMHCEPAYCEFNV